MAIVITAAGIYTVIPGETYIIAPSVSGTVKFQAAPGTVAPVDFAVSFTESGASGRIEMHDGNGPLSPAVSIADDVDIGHMQIDLLETVNADLTAGDNVTTGKIFGSHDGVDEFSFGDGATIGGIETEGGADAIVLGDGADFGSRTIDLGSSTSAPDIQPNTLVASDDLHAKAIKGGSNDDQVTLGAEADVEEIDLGGGDDLVLTGDGGRFKEIRTGGGEDEVKLGDGTAIEKLAMGKGDDIARIGSLDTPGSGTIVLDGGGGGSSSSSAAIPGGSSSSSAPDADCLFLDTSWLSAAERQAFFAELDEEGYVFDPVAGAWVGDGELEFELDDGTTLVLKDWENIKIVCFTRGTRILTPRGEIAIEDLKAGDAVLTMDSGFQEIRWIGSTRVPGKGRLAPIRIKAGALGNARDVVVSPQHRVLLKGGELEVLFGQNEALVAARHLVDGRRIVVEEGGEVEYFHMLFDQHEIVYSEGMPSESFHPGAVGLSGMARRTRREILGLFPELEEDVAAYGASCRKSLKAHEAKVAMRQGEVEAARL